MKKINVNHDACIGCGACVSIDPEHFDFNEDGLSEVISQENTESDEVVNALESCPTSAISYIEKDNCDCENCHCDNNSNCDCGGCHN